MASEDLACLQSIKINNVVVVARDVDGYVDATALCKAASKNFSKWYENKRSAEFLKVLSKKLDLPICELVKISTGGIVRHTWVHRKVAYDIAQWSSPEFAVQVAMWLDELLIQGHVSLNQKLTDEEELTQKFRQKLLELEAEKNSLALKAGNLELANRTLSHNYKKLQHNHNSMISRRTYHKLKIYRG